MVSHTIDKLPATPGGVGEAVSAVICGARGTLIHVIDNVDTRLFGSTNDSLLRFVSEAHADF